MALCGRVGDPNLLYGACAAPCGSRRVGTSSRVNAWPRQKRRVNLAGELLQPFVGGSRYGSLAGEGLSSALHSINSIQSQGRYRGVVAMVIPYVRGPADKQPPPDLASYIFHNRIVFLGMSLVPSVTELIMAEFLYLQYLDPEKPIYMYINSTGTTKDSDKLGYETEALAMYDVMRYVKPPIFTLCVGNAWGEAALLLANGAPGNRSALPSTTIMIREPIAQFRGQATDIDIARKEARILKDQLIELFAKHTGQTIEKIQEDIRRPKYFTPEQAADYGLIDKVLRTEKGQKSTGVVDQLRKAQLLR